MKFERIKPGMTLYDVGRHKMGTHTPSSAKATTTSMRSWLQCERPAIHGRWALRRTPG